MDTPRHKTHKRQIHSYTPYSKTAGSQVSDPLQTILEEGAKDAYSRQWHRIERGLRLNRLRRFVEDISTDYAMNKEEKDNLFLFLQKALDKKLLNTLKVVLYDTVAQRITSIKGLDMKRREDGQLIYELNAKKVRDDVTRKRKKEDLPSVSISIHATPATTATTANAAISTTPDSPLSIDEKIEEVDLSEEKKGE